MMSFAGVPTLSVSGVAPWYHWYEGPPEITVVRTAVEPVFTNTLVVFTPVDGSFSIRFGWVLTTGAEATVVVRVADWLSTTPPGFTKTA